MYVLQILQQRVKECYIKEGHFDGFKNCRKLDDDYEKSIVNFFIKCNFANEI